MIQKARRQYSMFISEGGNPSIRVDEPTLGTFIRDVNIDYPSRICSAPLETGVKSQDHIVRDPTVATVDFDVYNYASNFVQNMKRRKLNSKLFIVYTPDDYADNLLIKQIRSASDSNRPDITHVTVNLEEQIFVQSEHSKTTANPDDKAAVNTGYSSPTVR